MSSPSAVSGGNLGRLILTLVVAGAGGGAATALGVAGGWLTGALLSVLLAGKLGLSLGAPPALRGAALTFAGLTTGAMITESGLGSPFTLAVTLLGVVVTTALILAASYFAHRLIWRSSPATSFYCAWPGNTLLALVGAEMNAADLDRVVLVQSLRLLILVLALPMVVSGHAVPAAPEGPMMNADLAIGTLLALGCWWAARRLGTVGAEMFITVIVIGLLSYADLLHVKVPQVSIAFFQMVVGAFIALALCRCRMSAVRSALAPAVVGATIGAVMTLVAAWGLAALIGISPATAALAYAPGGAEAMILLAATFGIDPGFVGTHHTLRLIVLSLAFPLVAPLIRPKPLPKGCTGNSSPSPSNENA